MSHIMIMDDHPYMYELLSKDLAGHGHQLTRMDAADDLMEGIRESRPDLLLLDLCIEGFQGWDLLHKIKREMPELPVIILSAYENFRDDPRAAEADGYVVKEVCTDRLIEKVNHILKDRRSPK